MQFQDNRLKWVSSDSHFSHFRCYFPPISDGPVLYGTDRPGAGGGLKYFWLSRKTFVALVGQLLCELARCILCEETAQ